MAACRISVHYKEDVNTTVLSAFVKVSSALHVLYGQPSQVGTT